MFDNLLNDWSSTKSYATQANLEKALIKTGWDSVSPLLVRTPEGRFTAVFLASKLSAANLPIMGPAWAGFKVVG